MQDQFSNPSKKFSNAGMSAIGDLEDKIHAKETLKQRIRQKEQCTTTDNINIYSFVRIPRCCTSLWLLALEKSLLLKDVRSLIVRFSGSLARSWQFWAVASNKYYLDNENLTLSELPSVSIFGIPSMNEEKINALPDHNDKGIGLESEDAPLEQGSFSAASAKGYWRIGITEEDPSCDESTCNICYQQVIKGDLVHSLPCLHQFHRRCINPWLAVNASCPICKYMLGPGKQQSIESVISDDEMV